MSSADRDSVEDQVSEEQRLDVMKRTSEPGKDGQADGSSQALVIRQHKTFAEANKGCCAFMDMITEEYAVLNAAKTWMLVERESAKTVVDSAWVPVIVQEDHDVLVKTRLMLHEKSSWSDSHQESLRLMLAMAPKKQWHVLRFEARHAVTSEEVTKEVLFNLPEESKTPGKVCRLNKHLIGMKSTMLLWRKKINRIMSRIHFKATVDQDVMTSLNGDTVIMFRDGEGLIFWRRQEDWIQVVRHLRENLDVKVTDAKARTLESKWIGQQQVCDSTNND